MTVSAGTDPEANYATVTGWLEEFTGTNKKAYRSTVGNQLYLRVQDDGPGAGTDKEARITGYESMSDIDTGDNPFPTAAQGVGGVAMVVVRKSAAADSTPRAWKVLADDRTFYCFIRTGDVSDVYYGFSFGEIYSLAPGDSFRTIIVGRNTENSALITTHGGIGLTYGTGTSAATGGQFLARKYDGSGTSITSGKHMDQAKNGGTGNNVGVITYPNPPDGGLYICPVWIYEISNVLRGRFRGKFIPIHPIGSFNDGDTFQGTGALVGRTYHILKLSGTNAGHLALETSDTWETN
jgi:hypothetical protein